MAEPQNTKKRFRNDIILIAFVLVICAVGCLYLFVFRQSGDMVQITVDGVLYGTYSLSEDRVEEIRTGEDGHNRLIIRDGKAVMETASCPDGICVSHRPIFRVGESIVCLPNRVVVTVIGADDADAPDLVV